MNQKYCFFLFLICSLFLFGALPGKAHDFLSLRGGAERYGGVYEAPARRSLLSEANKGPDTALVAALDGTIYLLEVGSMRPVWSFSSGPQIYSSYQAPVNDKENASGIETNYFIDCGEDWELYRHYSLGKLKLESSLEEYISSTPQIAEDGQIILGSKKTTAFLVDARTGRVIHTYRMSDHPSEMNNKSPYNTSVMEQHQSGSYQKTDELPIYITRKDYILTSYMPNSNDVLWNITVAEIEAASLCQDIETSLEGTLPDLGSSEPNIPYNMPLPCQSRAVVYRFRNHTMLETLSLPSELPKARHQDMMLPASEAHVLPSQPNVEKILKHLSMPNDSGKLEALDSKEVKAFSNDGSTARLWKLSTSQLILVFIIILVSVFYHYRVVSRIKAKSAMQSTGTSSTNTHSRRKKSRRSVKGGSNMGKQDKEENESQLMHNESNNNFWLNLNKPSSSCTEGRIIGKLAVSNKEIAKGSNGTIVLEGIYEGRPVAVKRLVRAYNDIAFKEIQHLILSDRHPNIVRWYGVEQDQDFVYLALERCGCNFSDLILMHLNSAANPTFSVNLDAKIAAESAIHFGSLKGFLEKFDLWNSDCYPSPLLLKLMRDVISGLAHLHELGIVHRDLKPQNVLIISGQSPCAKLSDMGISKRLVGDISSLSNHATGCGSSGWQAPEQLLNGRQTRAVDLFSLGCVLFFCISGGRHPFGDRLERDVNIVKNKVDLTLVEHIPEAMDLFLQLLDPNAEMRPRAMDLLNHPLFWSAELRLSFLRDTSDRVELEDRGANSDLLNLLESVAPVALGANWDKKMEPSFLQNIGRYRNYKFDSVRDLLRVMRNKLNHYMELPAEIQEIIGPVPEGFDKYFRTRFPNLLIEVYKVMRKHCSAEDCFTKYFSGSGQ